MYNSKHKGTRKVHFVYRDFSKGSLSQRGSKVQIYSQAAGEDKVWS